MSQAITLPEPVASDIKTREPLYALPLYSLNRRIVPARWAKFPEDYMVAGWSILAGADFVWASAWRWNYAARRRTFYGAAWVKEDGKERHTYLHREIFIRHHGLIPDKFQIDHVDQLGWHNSPSNLRLASDSQQRHNMPKHRGSKYRFRGVTPCGWRATIGFNGGYLFLGNYRSESEAAVAYNRASTILHGDFGVPNLIAESETPSVERVAQIHASVGSRLRRKVKK